MAGSSREQLDALWRRVEEVRGLSRDSGSAAIGALDDPEAMVRLLGQLVDDLEQSHRRLIESNVQIVSLREVAGTLAGTRDAAEATRLVVRYLRGVLEFDQVGLLLVDSDRGVLTGTWAHGHTLTALELPLVGSDGAVVRSLWQHRTLEHRDPRRHPAVVLPSEHPLARLFAEQSSFVCVPLEPAGSSNGHASHPECRPCAVGRGASLAPAPGQDPGVWRAEMEERQQGCVRCPHLPLLGVLAVANGPGRDTAAEPSRLESVAFALAPMVENAQLVHALSRQERFLANVLDSMPSALVAFGPDGTTLSLNRTAEDLLGLREDDAAGMPLADLFGPEAEPLVSDTLTTGKAVSRQETVLRTPAGTALPVRMTTARLRDDRGNATGAIATFLDLTPLKAAEERARAMDRLAALGRFTSSVAHEIRNPLTGIGMGVRRLAKALAGQPAEAEHVEFVVSEIRRLDRIVQELFDVTHPRKLDLTPHALEDTLKRAVQSLAAIYEERGVRLVQDPEAHLPAVPHDADQMQQVFINLLKNAAEASPSGARVQVSLRRAPAPAHAVVVRVSDEGCGMNAETQRTLFEPFFTTKPKGTGLGLYITQDIVRRHGGSLTVSSEPGRGATFLVELPLEPQGGTR